MKYLIVATVSLAFLALPHSDSLATIISPEGLYWALQASYGTGETIQASKNNLFLEREIPHLYTPPRQDKLELFDPKHYFYTYARYAAEKTSLTAYVEGFAADTTPLRDWYTISSAVFLESQPFSNSSSLLLKFDWEIILDFDALSNQGGGKLSISLIDWTQTVDPQSPFLVINDILLLSETGQGTYQKKWTLRSDHEYLFSIGALAFLKGEDDRRGGYIEIRISNLNTLIIPEPASWKLLGIGFLFLYLWTRLSKINQGPRKGC